MSRPEIVITRTELAKLPEYSCSLPSGATIGKRWRRNPHFGGPLGSEPEWMIGEYFDIGSASKVGLRWSWAVSEPGSVHPREVAVKPEQKAQVIANLKTARQHLRSAALDVLVTMMLACLIGWSVGFLSGLVVDTARVGWRIAARAWGRL